MISFYEFQTYCVGKLSIDERRVIRQAIFFWPDHSIPLKVALDYENIIGKEKTLALLSKDWLTLSENMLKFTPN